jgi:hypothetical protein
VDCTYSTCVLNKKSIKRPKEIGALHLSTALLWKMNLIKDDAYRAMKWTEVAQD